MSDTELEAYFQSTENSPTRQELLDARAMIEGGVAIDCGCGAGSDIAYLLKEGFEVHAFDVEASSIERCHKRFADEQGLHLSQTDFVGFDYPAADLIVADASLFFCTRQDFPKVWQKIVHALQPGGVFVGSFLGMRDSMLTGAADYWGTARGFEEDELKQYFEGFELVRWVEHEMNGTTGEGQAHHWHIYAVILKKLA